METGSLRHKVDIERPVEVRGELGGTSEQFELFLENIWASVEPLSPSEYFAAAQVQSETSVRIRIRYRPGITSTMRVRQLVSRGSSPSQYRYFSIEGEPLSVLGRDREIHLMCKLREAEGFRTGAIP